jgi:peroxiredoxin
MDVIRTFLADRLRWSLFSLGLLIVGIGGLYLSAVPSSETTAGLIPAPRQGFLAPDFQLLSLEGDELELRDFRGHVVVLNLWASWCPPCRAEMPAIQSLYERYEQEGLIVLGVNMTAQDRVAAASTFVSEFGLTFPILLDESGLVANLYQMRALPTTFFIDRDGVIQNVVVGGPISEVTLRTMVVELLGVEG